MIQHDTNNIHTEATLKHIRDITLRQAAETKRQQHDHVTSNTQHICQINVCRCKCQTDSF